MENKELSKNKYGIEYTKVGDYYMPNLVLEKEEKIILNKYGRLRLKFLKENKKAEYTIMFMNGILNNHLKEILLSVFPENLKLKDLGKLVVIPTFYIGNEYNSWKAIFYNNLPNSETEDYRVVDVAMASSAAPVFFPSYDCHIDGGIIATDPSLASIIYAIDEELGKRMDQIRLLSFGTGYCYNSIKEDTSKWGAIDWVISKDPDLPIISVTLEGNAQLSQIFSKKLLDSNYYRVNPKMDKDISMDDTKSMDYLLELAEEYNIKDSINWINNKWNKI